MARKTPRPIEEARAIARSLRARYITPEAEVAAKAAMARLKVPPPGADAFAKSSTPHDGAPGERTLIGFIRQREGIRVEGSEETGDFTSTERDQAREILLKIQQRFATRQ
jgi:hypothetical protein